MATSGRREVDSRTDENLRGTTQLPGAVVACVTAVVSGVSIFVNSYGVRAVPQATVYTTAKNLVAAVLLAALALGWRAHLRTRAPWARRQDRPEVRPTAGRLRDAGLARLAGLAYIGVFGGGVAFVMFFEGLARTAPEPAAFLHDTMVVWVAMMALPALRERLGPWNLAAIVLLLAGQVLVSGGIGHLVAGEGDLLVLGATLLWSVEAVVARRLLAGTSPGTLAAVRMGTGVVVLLGFTAATGGLGRLLALRGDQVGWAIVSGALLAAYVGSWMVALSRSRALDVTSVLVGSVVVTALLGYASGHPVKVEPLLGLVLVVLGCAAVVPAWRRATARA
jgi:drug/metabolite transporter (DMT)-like permease